MKEDQARELAELYGCKYFETSAKTGKNVELVFKTGIEEVLKNIAENKYLKDGRSLEQLDFHGIKKLN